MIAAECCFAWLCQPNGFVPTATAFRQLFERIVKSAQFRVEYFLAARRTERGSQFVHVQAAVRRDADKTLLCCGRVCDWPPGVALEVKQDLAVPIVLVFQYKQSRIRRALAPPAPAPSKTVVNRSAAAAAAPSKTVVNRSAAAAAGAAAGAKARTNAFTSDVPSAPPVRRILSVVAPEPIASSMKVGVWHEQGMRRSMEDRHVAYLDLEAAVGAQQVPQFEQTDLDQLLAPTAAAPGPAMRTAFFGVYDGHDGVQAAVTLSEVLHVAIFRSSFFRESVSEAMKDGFRVTERLLQAEGRRLQITAGSTAVICMLQGDRLFVGNVGDSRAVLCRGGRAHVLTRDHKPNDPEERARITREGVNIVDGMVHNLLSVARSLGDYDTDEQRKIPGVSAEPEITELLLQDDCECLLIACDGLWDVMDSQAAIEFVRNALIRGETVDAAVQALVREALRRESCDNVSALLVSFHHRAGFEWMAQAATFPATAPPVGNRPRGTSVADSSSGPSGVARPQIQLAYLQQQLGIEPTAVPARLPSASTVSSPTTPSTVSSVHTIDGHGDSLAL